MDIISFHLIPKPKDGWNTELQPADENRIPNSPPIIQRYEEILMKRVSPITASENEVRETLKGHHGVNPQNGSFCYQLRSSENVTTSR